MSSFPLGGYKSLRYTGSSPGGTATSGNIALTYSPFLVTGRIIGIEFGSPMFDTATGSLYLFSSGNTWNGTRLVAQVNGVPQGRNWYPLVQYNRDATQGNLISGLGGNNLEHPFVDGEQLGIALSGTFNGGNALFIVHYV